jgi:hypothetical protein
MPSHAAAGIVDVDSAFSSISTTAAVPTRALITIRRGGRLQIAFLLQRHRRYAEQVGPCFLFASNALDNL